MRPESDDGIGDWLRRRRMADVPEGFADRAMDEIHRSGAEPAPRPPRWERLAEAVFSSRLARAAAIAAAAGIGFARILMILSLALA